ncbi:hypothetical protein ACI2K4_02740 [Micromonospora sp. NPDC050397]
MPPVGTGAGSAGTPSSATAWPLLLVAVFAPLAIRRYRRLSR